MKVGALAFAPVGKSLAGPSWRQALIFKKLESDRWLLVLRVQSSTSEQEGCFEQPRPHLRDRREQFCQSEKVVCGTRLSSKGARRPVETDSDSDSYSSEEGERTFLGQLKGLQKKSWQGRRGAAQEVQRQDKEKAQRLQSSASARGSRSSSLEPTGTRPQEWPRQ